MAKETLDRIDLKLLQALQSNAAMAMHAAADRVGLSVAACYKRVQRLKRSRCIAAEVAIVSPKTMGWPLVMLVLVTV
ncbi:AsnC family transcriptional regulator, partial [Acinetobacter baumannii]